VSRTLRNTLIVLTVIVGAAALVLMGISFDRRWWNPVGYGPGTMMNGYFSAEDSGYPWPPGYGMRGPDMMGPLDAAGLPSVEPLSLSEAENAVDDYLNAVGSDDLSIGEIMIFDNHAYAQIVETSTGIGAMEVLVDPATGSVYPEFGPNMMWNLKYSPMADSGMMGGYARSSRYGGMLPGQTTDFQASEMPVGPNEAVQFAQAYLDRYGSGEKADEHADTFYGYYTLHIEDDGSVIGMLSVNGFTGQVFVHTWHGEFIEMSEAHE
jgi:hypothetical protein